MSISLAPIADVTNRCSRPYDLEGIALWSPIYKDSMLSSGLWRTWFYLTGRPYVHNYLQPNASEGTQRIHTNGAPFYRRNVIT